MIAISGREKKCVYCIVGKRYDWVKKVGFNFPQPICFCYTRVHGAFVDFVLDYYIYLKGGSYLICEGGFPFLSKREEPNFLYWTQPN